MKNYYINIVILFAWFFCADAFAGNYQKSCNDITITEKGVLKASCETIHAFGRHNVSLDLNKYIGYQNKKLAWGGKNFAKICNNISVKNNGTTLWATCEESRYHSVTTWMQINLKISYRNGVMGLGARLSYDD